MFKERDREKGQIGEVPVVPLLVRRLLRAWWRKCSRVVSESRKVAMRL